jgi:hypothetical protein
VHGLILAHGPIGGIAALGLGAVATFSLLIALAVWSLSRPPKLSAPNGLVPLISIGCLTLLVNGVAALVWFFTDWTIAGRVSGDPEVWVVLLFVTLPSIIGGAAYVAWRR